MLVQLKERLEENNVLILPSNSIITQVIDALQARGIHQLRAKLTDIMQRLATLNIASYNALIAIQGSPSRGPDIASIQEPFMLVDPIACITPFHLKSITSWEIFDAVLDKPFQNLPVRA